MKNKRWKNPRKPQAQPSPRLSLWEDDWMEEEPQPQGMTLRFSPTAWAKLLYLRDKSPNEVGGFGISAPDDLPVSYTHLTLPTIYSV